tara:strand:+ start:392 stop:637 length:246 start_codon:yes stop_codon:yes gene_type:complete
MNREQVYSMIEGSICSDPELEALLTANNISRKDFIEHNVDLKVKKMGIKNSFMSTYFSVQRLEKELKKFAKNIIKKLKAKK